jgi:hypothetical protein
MLFNNRATFSRAGTLNQIPRGGRLTAQRNLLSLSSSTQSAGHSRDQSKSEFITVTTDSVTDGENPTPVSDIHVSFYGYAIHCDTG